MASAKFEVEIVLEMFL